MGAVYGASTAGPGTQTVTITPSDTVDLTVNCRVIRCTGTAGNVVLVPAEGSGPNITVALDPAAESTAQYDSLQFKRVNATNTTATGLVGIV